MCGDGAEDEDGGGERPPGDVLPVWTPLVPLLSFGLISRKRFIKSSCKSQFPHNFANLSLIITNIKHKLADLCGNWHLQNGSINTFCEIRAHHELKWIPTVKWVFGPE